MISGIADGTKNESVHIPVVLSQSGLTEVVYNDFFIGDNCDVVIVAGCGIDNCGNSNSEHDGIHRFFIGKIPKLNMWRSIMEAETEWARESSIRRP